MTQQEFKTELRRHLVAIIRACMLYWGMSWSDFRPHETEYVIGGNSTATLPLASETKTGV